MGLWYLSTVIFIAFAGLFWGISGDRLNPSADYKSDTGGLFYTCHQAGIAEAYSDGGFGSSGVAAARACRFGFPNLRRTELAKTLDVPNVGILAYRAIDMGDSSALYTNKRMVVTYIAPGADINSVPFNEVVRQMRTTYGDQISSGIVSAREAADPAGTYNKIINQSGLLVRIPTTVPVGSYAIMNVVNSAGWPAGCTVSYSGASCYRSFPPATFANAQNNCLADGGSMARIDSVNDMNDLFTFGGGDPSWGYWIDGFDTNNDNHYNYYGTNTPLTYADINGNPLPIPWAPGEPNNYGGYEDCMNLYPSRLINDLPCSYPLPYVCAY